MSKSKKHHDEIAIKTYFNQWHIYDIIIKNDYMAHAGIYRALRKVLATRNDQPFSMVDLGCGDASKIAKTLDGLPIRKYIGVDLSPIALEHAKQNMDGISHEALFIEKDFTEYLTSTQTKKVDIIVAGFTVHHLNAEDKTTLFNAVSQKLAPDGLFLYYDLFKRSNESREAYLSSYCSYIDETWHALAPKEREKTKQHIKDSDFPETVTSIIEMAQKAGLTPKSLFEDSFKFHRLYCFSS